MSLDAVKDWSAVANNNTSLGALSTLGNNVASVIDNLIRELMAQVAVQFGKINFKGSDIASATTTNLANATGNFVDITGTTTITGLGTVAAGQMFFLRFAGALTFTHNGTSLILPGAANITTANGDIAAMLSLGAGNWVCAGYTYASGLSVVGPTFTQTYSDNGALGGPDFVQMRESTSPGVGDVLGRYWFRGRDSAGNVQDYGLIAVVLDDPTSGSEDSHFEFYNVTAGSLALKLNLSATGINTVPIGQTTPAAGAFTTLSATGALTLSGVGAGQIVFPASQNASANANTFDDYEEGTFTPTIIGTGTAGAGTYSVQTGTYTKIGNRVLFDANLIWSAHTGTTNMKMAALPFTSDSTNLASLAFIAENVTFATTVPVAYVEKSATTCFLGSEQSGALVAVAIDVAASVYISGQYRV